MTAEDEARIAAAGAIFDLIGSRTLPLDRGQIADRLAAAALEAAARATPGGGEMHELVFTDRTARPAKWETRCGRTDVPLENAGSAQPGMHYPVTCKACVRIAGLEAALKRFERIEEAAIAKAAEQRVADLREVLWQVYAATGADTDGYDTAPEPGVMTPDVPQLALEAVRELREDYREALAAGDQHG